MANVWNLIFQPFELDYFQVFFTLCDILVEVYQKILSFLGPVSKTGQYSNLTQVGPTALNASTRSGVGLSQMLVEVVLKIDHKLKVQSESTTFRAQRLRISPSARKL